MIDSAFTLADLVRLRRERLGLRQDELADLAGCSTRFVHTVEAGKQTLRLDKLITVLNALGLGLVVRRGQPGITVAPPESGEAR
jgi:y4mF family transcriptional regulator